MEWQPTGIEVMVCDATVAKNEKRKEAVDVSFLGVGNDSCSVRPAEVLF